MDAFAMIPEPTMLKIRSPDFAIDKAAMSARVTDALSGNSAAEVIALLTEAEIQHTFVSEDVLSVVSRKSFMPVPASYSCNVDIRFEDGAFVEVVDIWGCGLDAM
ncbi:MAG: hypothetical protein AAGH70_00450 [Pseudomonadota bacterium]